MTDPNPKSEGGKCPFPHGGGRGPKMFDAGAMRYVVFTPSGSESNDVAIKSARRATGRRKVVALAGG